MSFFDPQQAALTVAAAFAIYALYQRYNRPSLKDIPGPPNPSWVHGRFEDLIVTLFTLLTATRRSSMVLGEPRRQCR